MHVSSSSSKSAQCVRVIGPATWPSFIHSLAHSFSAYLLACLLTYDLLDIASLVRHAMPCLSWDRFLAGNPQLGGGERRTADRQRERTGCRAFASSVETGKRRIVGWEESGEELRPYRPCSLLGELRVGEAGRDDGALETAVRLLLQRSKFVLLFNTVRDTSANRIDASGIRRSPGGPRCEFINMVCTSRPTPV